MIRCQRTTQIADLTWSTRIPLRWISIVILTKRFKALAITLVWRVVSTLSSNRTCKAHHQYLQGAQMSCGRRSLSTPWLDWAPSDRKIWPLGTKLSNQARPTLASITVHSDERILTLMVERVTSALWWITRRLFRNWPQKKGSGLNRNKMETHLSLS